MEIFEGKIPESYTRRKAIESIDYGILQYDDKQRSFSAEKKFMEELQVFRIFNISL